MIKLWYMTKQIIFLIATLVTLGVFAWTMRKIFQYFALTKAAFPIKDIGKRIELTLKVAVGQTKILRKPLIGMIHALVWWGFIVILVGSIEMIIDGISGTERVLSFMGPVYNFLIAAGDIFGLVILIAILIFLVRRNFITVERFEGVEMKKISHQDANVALGLIGLLMLSLLGMNLFYQANELAHGNEVLGSYPVTAILVPYVQNMRYAPLARNQLVGAYLIDFHLCQRLALLQAFSCVYVGSQCVFIQAQTLGIYRQHELHYSRGKNDDGP
jgi:nitrate reductase gamma subunit